MPHRDLPRALAGAPRTHRRRSDPRPRPPPDRPFLRPPSLPDPSLGIRIVPALVALWLDALFPIVGSTYTGVRDADPRACEAAIALGMTPSPVLRQIRVSLAAPVILAEVRTAAVLTVGTATLAALIGAGGLGEPIVTGLQLADTPKILSGAIPAALLA